MDTVILQAAALILFGVVWRIVTPQGLGADEVRGSLTGVVYLLLLPALVLLVLWRAPLDLDALRIALVAALAVGIGMGAAWLLFRLWPLPRPALGALLLAAAFPNATYMGLPVLEATFGEWARRIAIQYDLFACTPLLLSGGVLLAARLGGRQPGFSIGKTLLRVPPLWAAAAGVGLNLLAVPLPKAVAGLLEMLAAGVVPLMLFSLGLGLRWRGAGVMAVVRVSPVVVIQLVLTPLLISFIARAVGLQGETMTAVVLEAAMPSMVLGIVLCDRYGLDTNLYAMAVTLSTALSIFTLPLWFAWVG